VQIRELQIPDAYEVIPAQHEDDRGVFLESYRADVLESELGHRFTLKQSNLSVSARGTVRGIHYALVPPGQAKYVTVVTGSALDYVVDLRTGSPTFGRSSLVELDDVSRNAVYIGEGLGHAFLATSDSATVSYFVSEFYAPEREFAINPFDPEIGLDFPLAADQLNVSEKDRNAMSLSEAASAGLLPGWQECQSYYAQLKS
jgi:dTDP-4-dehydrorhamnose 3,5-epimerase